MRGDDLSNEVENSKNQVFPVDIEFEDDTVYLLKQYYNITEVPAVIFKNKVFQGKVVKLPILQNINSLY